MVGGGGGVIVPAEIARLRKSGVMIFSPEGGQPMVLAGMINSVVSDCDFDLWQIQPADADSLVAGDRFATARAITGAESGNLPADLLPRIREEAAGRATKVLGVTGTGGSGKSSLTAELVRRFRVDQQDKLRIAVIAVDPTQRKGPGALLGDRIRANSLEGDRTFFRSPRVGRGKFPFAAGVFGFKRDNEDPARMFAGEGDPFRTNRPFKLLSEGRPATRLSTAFDSVTLYGRDPDERPDIYGKVGSPGVSVATLEDMRDRRQRKQPAHQRLRRGHHHPHRGLGTSGAGDPADHQPRLGPDDERERPTGLVHHRPAHRPRRGRHAGRVRPDPRTRRRPGATETGYQRGRVQDESMGYEHRKFDGTLPIIGVNTFLKPASDAPPQELELARATATEKQSQVSNGSTPTAAHMPRRSTRRSHDSRMSPLLERTCSPSSWTPPAYAPSSRSPRPSSRSAARTAATSDPGGCPQRPEAPPVAEASASQRKDWGCPTHDDM
ncbi:hypothetical protein BJ988_000497 [Nocardioides panzhihuensis]|uniref:Methylmalonyl-CoA mutase alpha/beta chain catalytic domain-containing protein n=1 Tax=Nocardioides panzhihuensis TaxID=860243 RepID=A0A7Z0DI71_9ACTN|nr:hypothetical protein [Nocardioides panzhihuensis]